MGLSVWVHAGFFFVHLLQLEAMLAVTLSDQTKIFEKKNLVGGYL